MSLTVMDFRAVKEYSNSLGLLYIYLCFYEAFVWLNIDLNHIWITSNFFGKCVKEKKMLYAASSSVVF